MGEEREDLHKLKRIVVDSYDYDKDSRWLDYWNNVLIPPHIASRSDVVSRFKRKFYQCYVGSIDGIQEKEEEVVQVWPKGNKVVS